METQTVQTNKTNESQVVASMLNEGWSVQSKKDMDPAGTVCITFVREDKRTLLNG